MKHDFVIVWPYQLSFVLTFIFLLSSTKTIHIIMYIQPFSEKVLTNKSHLKLSPLQPLSGVQSNGPGLHYRVMWRQKVVENDWNTVTVANNSKFVVSGTPTFVPYELKVQAVNDHGHAPEPAIAHGYSGEDCEFDRPFKKCTMKSPG